MSGYQELESRVTTLEERLDEQAGLRASQDRDLADVSAALRAQSTTIQALAVTQSEHTKQIRQLDSKLGQLDTKLGQLDTKVGQLDTKVGQLDTKVGQLDTKLGQLDSKVDRVSEDVRLIITMLGRPKDGDSSTPA